ncbi:hypothetical protein PAP_06460 [Palaeococcus pacificus DY20341]|uniref:C2H2-type domain-containing protein n=1 Tax=Palaeococcus pacificus DY20341 TaxID=1343739 RepID=A0A075LTL1_9EURY|nr:hypothetical protein [Palaeococcus pacificus]AIF69689.1 hypothetical protein PAP_06460 [Palaeococcus pacificus DY20341]
MEKEKFTKPQSFELICPFCGYKAKDLEDLKRHVVEKHTLNREDVRGVRF